MDPSELREDLREKICFGKEMLAQLANNRFKKVQGLPKLEKKVRQELKFLEKFESPENVNELKKEHISCSNLVHLGSIIEQLFLVQNPSSVMQPFNLTQDSKVKKICVDIVCDKGQSWLKVVARNPIALDQNSQGGSQFGQRSFIDQVKELVRCAAQNELLFRAPSVRIIFASGVTKSLHRRISKIGAQVDGEIVVTGDEEEDDGDEDDDGFSDHMESSSEESETEADYDGIDGIDETKLNLDITAMIAYVSALTNGRNMFQYKEKILSEQAVWERSNPVKPELDKIFLNKELICCQSAMKDFTTILNTLGGEGERERGLQFIQRIKVVPDSHSVKTEGLQMSGKIKDRSLCIFATGDNLRVLTVTANTGFIRAAAGQGANFAVVTHQSRALTEDKEKFATALQSQS